LHLGLANGSEILLSSIEGPSEGEVKELKWGKILIVKVANCNDFLRYTYEFNPDAMNKPGDPACVGGLTERMKPPLLSDVKKIWTYPELYLIQSAGDDIRLVEKTPDGVVSVAKFRWPQKGIPVNYGFRSASGSIMLLTMRYCGGGIYYGVRVIH
jgi:hypothetical protein